MQKLAASLLPQISPKVDETEMLRAKLDGLIDQLERQQQTLERRLSAENRGAKRRHLKTALAAGRLQLKKARTLQTTLRST